MTDRGLFATPTDPRLARVGGVGYLNVENMKRLIVFCLFGLVVLGVSACSRKQTARISDVTRAETSVLKKKATQGTVHGLSIVGAGAIVGTAEVQWILDAKVYRKETISGPVRFEFAGDWYYDAVEIRYIPRDVSSGEITLTSEFKS